MYSNTFILLDIADEAFEMQFLYCPNLNCP